MCFLKNNCFILATKFLLFCSITTGKSWLFDETPWSNVAVGTRRQDQVILPCRAPNLHPRTSPSTESNLTRSTFANSDGQEFEFILRFLKNIHNESIELQSFNSSQVSYDPSTGAKLKLNLLLIPKNQKWFYFECRLVSAKYWQGRRVILLLPNEDDLDQVSEPSGDTQRFLLISANPKYFKMPHFSNLQLYYFVIANPKVIVRKPFHCLLRQSLNNEFLELRKVFFSEQQTIQLDAMSFSLFQLQWDLPQMTLNQTGTFSCGFASARHQQHLGTYIQIEADRQFMHFPKQLSVDRPLIVQEKESVKIEIRSEYQHPGPVVASWSFSDGKPIDYHTTVIKPDNLLADSFHSISSARSWYTGIYQLILNQTFLPELPAPAPKNALAIHSVLVRVLAPPDPFLYKRLKFFVGQVYSIVCRAFTASPISMEWQWAQCTQNDCDRKLAKWNHLLPNDNKTQNKEANHGTTVNKEDFFDFNYRDAVSERTFCQFNAQTLFSLFLVSCAERSCPSFVCTTTIPSSQPF